MIRENHCLELITEIADNCLPSPRERPAAISIDIKSIDDTSNFDDFPESDILQPGTVKQLQFTDILYIKTYT